MMRIISSKKYEDREWKDKEIEEWDNAKAKGKESKEREDTAAALKKGS